MLHIQDAADGCTVPVRVQPRARRDAVCGEHDGALKISLRAAPVEGKANAACTEFLAKLLKVPKSSVSITAGQTGRNKVAHVRGMCADELRSRLGAQIGGRS
ncbi:MAG TPA: DUF167 domain-containing protein [Terriglobales bacterium]|nr:DUF167 domain-containing protein [Terriglobales bacterium]